MKRLFKHRRARKLDATKEFPTRLTAKSDLVSLMHRLRPVSFGQELVRLGPEGDGGYLVPDDLEGIEACFSPGVSCLSGFEIDCAESGMKAFLADGSVERPAEIHRLFDFTRKHVGITSNHEFMTLDHWVASAMPGTHSELLLQMDVEGFEYEVLMSISEALMRRLRIIVVEFHQLDMLWSRPFFGLASRVFDKLLQTHSCVHLHPNNCCGSLDRDGLVIPRVMEFTFLRRDRVKDPSDLAVFPNPLDHDNTDGPHLALPACWIGR